LVRVAVGLVTVLAVLAAVTAVIAVRQRNETGRQRDLAKTNAATADANATKAADKAAEASYQALVARSAALTDTDRSAAMLLAVEANKRRPNTVDSTGALFTSLTADPNFVGYLRSDTQPFTSVVVDSEHDLVIAGTVDGKVVRWRLSDRQRFGEPIRIEGRGNATRVAVGGGVLVAARNGGGGAVLDEATGRQLATFALKGQGGEVIEIGGAKFAVDGIASVAVSGAGGVFAVGGFDGRLEVRSTADASIIAELAGVTQCCDPDSDIPIAHPRSVAFDPAGHILSADISGQIGTYLPTDLSTVGLSITATVGSGGLSYGFPPRIGDFGVTASRDGTQLWYWTPSGAQRFDRVTGAELWSSENVSTLGRNRGWSGFGAVDTASGRVFMSTSGTVVSWTGHLRTSTNSRGIDSRNGIESDRTYDLREGSVGAMAADSEVLAVASADTSVVAVWGLDGHSALGDAYVLGESTTPINFSPDGSALLVSSVNGVQRLDLLSGKSGSPLNVEGWSYLMADDEVLAPSCCGDTSVLESVKAATGAVVATFPEQQLLGFINPTIDRTGHMIAIEASDAMVLDNRGTTIWSRSQPTGPYAGASTNTFAFSPDGQRLAIGTSTEVEVFDIAANRLLATLPGISESAAFTADGNELIVGGSLSTAQRYLTDTWAPIGRSITNFPSGILSMRARADGLLVILSNGLRLSDLATGTSVGRELKVSTNLLASGFADGLISADGLKVTTRNSEEDGVVVWDLNPADWPVAACLAAGRNLSKAEWVASFGDEPYRVTCEQWPAND
jgi:hypothetical protein